VSENFFGFIDDGFAHFDEHEKAHIKVMRMIKGSKIRVMDGKGKLFEGTLIDKDRATIDGLIESTIPDRIKIHLILSPIRWERLRFAVEKASEFGVSTIVLTNFDRTTRKENESKIRKVSLVVRDAIKQSGTLYVPVVEEMENFKLPEGATKLILDQRGESTLRNSVNDHEEFVLAFGPEGGFTDREREFFNSLGFKMVKIWSRTLRVETAVVSAISIVRFLKCEI